MLQNQLQVLQFQQDAMKKNQAASCATPAAAAFTRFTERVHNVPGLERRFSPLVPQQWAACALAYMKEVDVLATKKTVTRTPKAADVMYVI